MQGALFETNIKYELLDKMLESYITNVQYSDELNVIVDLKSVFKKIYRTNINNIIKEQKIIIEDVTSHIINLIGFYRNYFAKKGKYSNVYLIYSKNECKIIKDKYSNYKKDYYDKYLNNTDEYQNLNNIVKSTVKQVEAIVEYIPHTYFIDSSKFDEFCFINYIINKSGNTLNILLSNDIVLYQLLNKNTIVIDLKGENSSIVNNQNVIEYLCKKESVLNGNVLNLLLSITGNSEYSLNNVPFHGYKKAEKILSDLYNDSKILNTMYMNCPNELFLNSILLENKETVINNFKILFPIELYMSNENRIEEMVAISKIKSKANYSYNELTELNQKIFLLYPLNIPMILRGEI